MFAADRAEHVDSVIRPALERGAVVITDRYIDSSVAYQGAGRNLAPTEIARISRWATDGLVPHLTVLLDVSPETARERFTEAPDRLESEPAEFHQRVRAGFLTLAAADPARYLVVDAGQEPEAVTTVVRHRLDQVLPLSEAEVKAQADARKAAEEEARRKAEEEAARKAEEERLERERQEQLAKLRAEEEERKRREAEEARAARRPPPGGGGPQARRGGPSGRRGGAAAARGRGAGPRGRAGAAAQAGRGGGAAARGGRGAPPGEAAQGRGGPAARRGGPGGGSRGGGRGGGQGGCRGRGSGRGAHCGDYVADLRKRLRRPDTPDALRPGSGPAEDSDRTEYAARARRATARCPVRRTRRRCCPRYGTRRTPGTAPGRPDAAETAVLPPVRDGRPGAPTGCRRGCSARRRRMPPTARGVRTGRHRRPPPSRASSAPANSRRSTRDGPPRGDRAARRPRPEWAEETPLDDLPTLADELLGPRATRSEDGAGTGPGAGAAQGRSGAAYPGRTGRPAQEPDDRPWPQPTAAATAVPAPDGRRPAAGPASGFVCQWVAPQGRRTLRVCGRAPTTHGHDGTARRNGGQRWRYGTTWSARTG